MAPPQPVRRAARGVVVCAGAAAILCGAARAQVGAGAAQQPQQPPRAQQQQLIGYVKADDADVTGATDVLDGQAVLAGSVGVTAKSHTAVVTLGRGGLARVCQTSSLHMTQGKSSTAASSPNDAGATAPLLFSLDRGAVEIRMNGLANDSIMTPDLRMTVQANGPLDVRLRVARNGDTCVENHGAAAPALAVSDPFGTSMYELMAGQHVLFEHGDLHEVVDHETEPCGCPDDKGATVADALLAPGGAKLGGQTSTPVAGSHPFPAAISEGLAPTAERPVGEANPAQPQATDSLRYNADQTAQKGTGAGGGSGQTQAGQSTQAQAQTGQITQAQAKQPPAAKKKRGHALGRFFRALFGS